jgi:hypothetical protein
VFAVPSGWLNLDGNERYSSAGGTYDWANSGTTTSCAGGGVSVTGSGGLFDCGSAGAGSAPPNAPKLTAVAAADASVISAQFVADPISGDTTACGSGDPTTMGGQNGDTVSSYATGTGPVPAKDDLSNVFAVSHTRSDTGRPELYFGAERLVNNGDSHVDFEFLQSVVTLTSACAGNLSGHRTQGDLLAAVDFTSGGSLGSYTLYQWHCAADPGTQPADGTVCDPSGGPEHYQPIAASAVTVEINSAATVLCGGWICRDSTGASIASIDVNDLLEGGINLGELPFTGCFHTFLPHTRTAQSFTATLKDFAGPIPLNSCRTPAMSSTSSPSGSTSLDVVATDTVAEANGGAGPAPTGTVSFFLCGPSAGGGCPSGGSAVGSAKPLIAGSVTSDAAPAASAAGTYCWRAEYTPDPASQGIYEPSTHTNASTECFAISVPGFPDTGRRARPRAFEPRPAALALALLALASFSATGWRRRRS